MGKFQVKLCILLCWALTSMYSDAQREDFIQSRNLTWVDARNYCQICFKELVTVTPDNSQTIAQIITSDHWIGLRKNFNFKNNSIDNSTSNLASTVASYTQTYFTTNYMNSSDTSSPIVNWTQWANGDPLAFQNWYPGWPLPKPSPKPPNKTVCCSCACTCPAQATTPLTTTPNMTTTQSGETVTSWSHDLDEITADITSSPDQSTAHVTGTQSTNPSFTTSAPWTTAEKPLEAECVRSPMLQPEEPEVEDDRNDKNYIEDSCVAMLSFGPWIEKSCLDLLPFICYEDRFMGQVNVTNITFASANLTWIAGPGNISHYRVYVKGQKDNQTWVVNVTDLTYELVNLTSGTSYSVQVFPVKCERDLNPENTTFYTIPKAVTNLTVSFVDTNSVNLTWNKPEGNVDFYLLTYNTTNVTVQCETTKVTNLTPGTLYNFTVVSGVNDSSKWSYEAHVSACTKPDKVSNLRLSDNTAHSMFAKWDPPYGNFRDIFVNATDQNGMSLFQRVLNQAQQNVTVTGLPPGTRILVYVTVRVSDTLVGETVENDNFTTPENIQDLTLNTTSNTLNATWVPPNGTSLTFTVVLSLNQTVVNTTTNVTQTNITFSGLKNAANYSVAVYAVSGLFNSSAVYASMFTLPNPPTNVIAIAANKSSITFTWNKPDNTETPTYGVQLSSSFWGQSWTNTTSDTTFTFSGLTSGTNYSFNVHTIAGGQNSVLVPSNKSTDPDLREISLSMLCSSSVSLLCDDNTTRMAVFNKLRGNFSGLLEGNITWDFKY